MMNKQELRQYFLDNKFTENVGEKDLGSVQQSFCYRKTYQVGEKIIIHGFEVPKQTITIIFDTREDKNIYYSVWDDNNQKYFTNEMLEKYNIDIFTGKDVKKISQELKKNGFGFTFR